MTTKYLIWDLPLRIFHWVLVISLVATWYTSDQDNGLIDYHLICGYTVLGLIVFRIVWGFIGTRHSQFKNFIPSPSQLVKYIKQSPEVKDPAGHNPLGSLMVVFMLTIILLQAVSGLFMNDDIFTAGPYNGAIDRSIEKILVFIHRNSFDFILGAVALHIAAIFYYKKFKNKSLVLPMITGYKPAKDTSANDAIKHSKVIMAIILALIVTAFIYWLVVINAPVSEEYYY